RMRVEMTVSDSGPVPRSHSPRFGSMSFRFIRSLPPSDQVAQPGGVLEALLPDRPPELAPELGVAAGVAAGDLAAVAVGAVDPLQQPGQGGPERLVVVGAAETTGRLEFMIPQTARGANQPARLRAGPFLQRQEKVEHAGNVLLLARRRQHAVRAGALLAQVYLARRVLDDLGEVDRGRVAA